MAQAFELYSKPMSLSKFESSALSFELQAVCPWSGARAGLMHTPHGVVETPVFMPVGTNAALRALTWEQTADCGAQIVLSNSYHLYLRPGHELIKQAGGLHKFMCWDKPILTDSGGFQVFSLDMLRKITEEGVHFKDHKGGRKHFIGPTESMAIQNAIGPDIMMAFDECVKNPATYEEAQAAMDRTHRWLGICVDKHARKEDQALFGIVQGSMYEELRSQSVKAVTSYDLPGYAIGGVAVGEDRSTIERIVLYTPPLSCLPISPVISWVWARPGTSSMPLDAVSTCLIVSPRPDWHATAQFLAQRDACLLKTQFTARILDRLMPIAPAPPAKTIPVPICTI
jgi:tRNA-guanine transglycosylase